MAFDFDIFPESSYDDTSGEYSADFNFDPIEIGSVLLTESGKVYADIFSIDEVEEATRITAVLQEIASQGQFEPDYNPKNPHDYPPIPDDLDRSAKHTTRGPFIGQPAVDRFLRDTGLEDISSVYYDDEIDAFWIDIDSP